MILDTSSVNIWNHKEEKLFYKKLKIKPPIAYFLVYPPTDYGDAA